jgi:hypothetical protein
VVRRAQEEGTTIAGAVGAAAMLAVRAEQQRPERRPIDLQINVCLRGNALYRGYEVLEESLVHTSLPLFRVFTPERHEDVWSLARAVRAEIGRGIRSGEWVESLKEMAYARLTHRLTLGVMVKGIPEVGEDESLVASCIVPLICDLRFACVCDKQKYAQGRLCGVSLSSMGDLDQNLNSDHTALLRPLRCAAGVDVGQLGPYLMVVCLTINGCLGFSVSTADPVVSDEQARRMMATMVGALLLR